MFKQFNIFFVHVFYVSCLRKVKLPVSFEDLTGNNCIKIFSKDVELKTNVSNARAVFIIRVDVEKKIVYALPLSCFRPFFFFVKLKMFCHL
jgi:hypothetical protein